MESHLAEERNDKKRRQPYLLGIGERNNPTQFFIVVDDLAIPCEGDITEAVDKLFKVHYVFNIRYADEVYGFFAFIQNFVYGIRGQEAVPARAREMMASITALEVNANKWLTSVVPVLKWA